MKKTIQELQQQSKLVELKTSAQKHLKGGGVIEEGHTTSGVD